jgi:hypothetical protein
MWLRGALEWLRERCRFLWRRSAGRDSAFECQDPHCPLWTYHRPMTRTDVPGANGPETINVSLLQQEHMAAVAGFHGRLPAVLPGHDWDGDARFHGLSPSLGDSAASTLRPGDAPIGRDGA